MKIINDDMNLYDFPAWGQGERVKQEIIDADKATEFEQFIDEMYPEGIIDGQLNDILAYDWEYVYNVIGIEYEA